MAVPFSFLLANRFEIERAIGVGGMGTVYRAHDRYTDRFVALKLPHLEADGSPSWERFDREARILAELQHPGIVAYVAHGQAPSGQRYLAMEWLDGETLALRLASRGMLAKDPAQRPEDGHGGPGCAF
jgi:serine/threonine protein kinase